MKSAGLKLRAKRFDTHACLRNQARQRARLDRLMHGDDDGACQRRGKSSQVGRGQKQPP